jgi:hypothetical protein
VLRSCVPVVINMAASKVARCSSFARSVSLASRRPHNTTLAASRPHTMHLTKGGSKNHFINGEFRILGCYAVWLL